MFFLCTWYTPTQCSNGHSRCSVTLVSRVKSKKKCWRSISSSKIVVSGLPCKICHQSTAILKTFGDFSLVCGLQFVEQQFNWMILILWALIGSKLKWSSGANNDATRRSYLAPGVVCQTEWRENYTRALQNYGNMSIFNHSMFRFCFIS